MEKTLEQITLIKESLEKLKEYQALEEKVGMPLTEFVDLHYVELKEENLSGEEVSQEIIDEIKTYFLITGHALERLSSRTNMVSYENGEVNYAETIKNIKYRINRRILAYYNTDDSVNIAIDRYNYFVFEKNKEKGIWVLITFKEKSYNDNDIFYKQRLAKMGIERG